MVLCDDLSIDSGDCVFLFKLSVFLLKFLELLPKFAVAFDFSLQLLAAVLGLLLQFGDLVLQIVGFLLPSEIHVVPHVGHGAAFSLFRPLRV